MSDDPKDLAIDSFEDEVERLESEIERLRGENEQLRVLVRWLVDEDGNAAGHVRGWLNNDRPDLLPLFDSIVGGET